MAKVNYHVRAGKKISLDTLLGFLVMIIPVAVFFLTMNGENPFIDGMTSLVVLLMSVFLLLVIWINRHARIPMLGIFVLIYVIFWHLRFLTLALFPAGELVLSRTVVVDQEIFNTYVWVVFLSLIATVVGILIAYIHVLPLLKEAIKNKKAEADELSEAVKKNIHGIFVYCMLALAYMIYATQMPEEALPEWLGYLGFFFPFGLILLLVVLVLLNMEVSIKYRLLFLIYILAYVVLTVLAGSRSIMLYFGLSVLFLFAIFNKRTEVKFRHFVLILLLGLTVVFSFAYGTFQRHMRSMYGFNANAESTEYVLERMSSLEDWEQILGMAFARAGSLDYSAEMFANPKYGEVVTIENILKGTIDGYIPGAVFEDSRLIEQRIINIYNPNAEGGYQSDAIGVVGENYLLFGNAFPLVIAFVAFAFTYLYYAASGSILGVYIKFSLALSFMSWWNSFGYDWLLLDIGRQIVFGMLVIAIIFRRRGELSQNNKVGSVGA